MNNTVILQTLSDISEAECIDNLLSKVTNISKSLGFDYFAYGIRTSYPFTSPNIFMGSNYPSRWRDKYLEQKYFNIDPIVGHCGLNDNAIAWSNRLEPNINSVFWEEARAFGITTGWSIAANVGIGARVMLTYSRNSDALSSVELRYLVPFLNLLSIAFSNKILTVHSAINSSRTKNAPSLSPRELEILKWTSEGKSSEDISRILSISKHTVEFHLKNTTTKFGVPNKTAAVVKAIFMGYLH